jgi:hypothetical protein
MTKAHKELEQTLRKITNDFTTHITSSTCMGWSLIYDEEGRLISGNPNYQNGKVNINGKEFFFVKRMWTVWVFDKPANYHFVMNKSDEHIFTVDITPSYLKKDGK